MRRQQKNGDSPGACTFACSLRRPPGRRRARNRNSHRLPVSQSTRGTEKAVMDLRAVDSANPIPPPEIHTADVFPQDNFQSALLNYWTLRNPEGIQRANS